ncbi:MAG: hypothetical protein HY765_06770 [Rhodomicrobium sp.]|nr:hypothetical protein [Rhodomicrobium sp.]
MTSTIKVIISFVTVVSLVYGTNVSTYVKEVRATEGKEEQPATKQKFIINILNSYNAQILHDKIVEENIRSNNISIAIKPPSQILIIKNDKIQKTIDDKILERTIRYNLLNEYMTQNSQYGAKGLKEKCIKYIIETVLQYIGGKLIEKTVKVCAEYISETPSHQPETPPDQPEPHPYPQAEGYPPGCYKHPNGQVLCE